MTPEMVLDIGRETLWVTALLAAPMLLSALAVGLFVGMIQAATQIQEMTLTFVPKIIAVMLAALFLSSWMVTKLVDYTQDLITSLPMFVR